MRRYTWFLIAFAAGLLLAGVSTAFSGAVSQAAAAPDGMAVFGANCASCHQKNGQGAGPFPPLAGNPDVVADNTNDLIATILHGKTGAITILGKQYSGAMPAWRDKLSNAEVAAVLSYIRSAWTNKAPIVTEDQVALVAKPVMLPGQAIFAAKCATCHQANGQGNAQYPPLDGNAAVIATDPKEIVGIIVNGRSGPLTVDGKSYNGTMPTWKGQLSNPDIAAVATYIRAAWSNHAAPVTEQMVASAGTQVSTAVGQSLYNQKCVACHKANGTGMGPFPALAGNKDVKAADASAMLSMIVKGKGTMPSWRGQLSDADIAAIATYVRSAWGNGAAPVSDADVKGVK